MLKKLILSCIFSIILVSNLFALTSNEVLVYKGRSVTIVKNSSVLPYSIRGVVIDLVTNNDEEIFLMLQTNDYRTYAYGISFINIDQIIKIVE
jgi:hypothetical protein